MWNRRRVIVLFFRFCFLKCINCDGFTCGINGRACVDTVEIIKNPDVFSKQCYRPVAAVEPYGFAGPKTKLVFLIFFFFWLIKCIIWKSMKNVINTKQKSSTRIIHKVCDARPITNIPVELPSDGH